MNITYEYTLTLLILYVKHKMLQSCYKKIKHSKLNSSEHFINKYNSIPPSNNVGSTILHLYLLHSGLNCTGDAI